MHFDSEDDYRTGYRKLVTVNNSPIQTTLTRTIMLHL